MIQFITEHLEKWIAPDGGGMLDLDDTAPAHYGCSLDRTKNQNGILYLVHPAFEFVTAHPQFNESYKRAYETHMRSTEIIPGLHSRSCGDRFNIRQSHDNILAMLIGGWLFKSSFADKVFQFLDDHKFNYNVADPYAFDSRCQMQGGDVAIAHYTVNKTPPLWCVWWLAIGLAFTTKWNLADLRVSFLKQVIFKTIPKHQSYIVALGMIAHGLHRGTRQSKFRMFDFKPEHPFVKFLEARG